MLYYARPLESKHSDETIAALQDIVNDIQCRYKSKVIFRMHSDRASELCGDKVKDLSLIHI